MATTVSLKPNAVEISGSTSGTTTLQATAVAGTTTLTLPAATDTLVGRATTDTLTNKTLTGAAMNGTLGATTPSTASVTTLTTSSTITHNGGTANGVAYLDGSKVLTTGSALVFDGTNLGVGVTPTGWSGLTAIQVGQAASLFAQSGGNFIGGYVGSNIYYNAGWKYIRNGYATKYSFNETNNGQHQWWIAPNNTSGAGAAATETQAMTLDASGNLLVGTTTTSPGSGNTATGNYLGALGVASFSRSGDACLTINTNTNSKVCRIYRSGSEVGDITVTTTSTAFNSTSDYRLKTVLSAVSDSGSRIDALEPIEYIWNSTGLHTRGFLAHKFQEVYANSVTGTKDAVNDEGKPEYQSMQAGSSEVIADLVAEIQSLRKRLSALESA